MPGAILFDLDDTLIDLRGPRGAVRGWAEDVAARFPEIAAAELVAVDGDGRTERAAMCAEMAARWPARFPDGAAAWEDFAAGVSSRARALPGARALVDRLRARAKVAVVTNGGARTQRAKLRAAGLDDLPAIVSGEVGHEKPEPAIFARALAAVGVGAEAAIFVGDDPVCDVLGARRAGLRVLWIARGRRLPDGVPAPDFTCASLDEAAPILESFGEALA